jgi:hypothetical protein
MILYHGSNVEIELSDQVSFHTEKSIACLRKTGVSYG